MFFGGSFLGEFFWRNSLLILLKSAYLFESEIRKVVIEGHGLSAAIKLGSQEKTVGASITARPRDTRP